MYMAAFVLIFSSLYWKLSRIFAQFLVMVLTKNAIGYAVRHLLAVALPDWPMPVVKTSNSDFVILVFPTGENIVFPLLDEVEIQDFKQGRARAVLLSSADGGAKIPVFIPAIAGLHRVDCGADSPTLHIPYDFISITFLLLSREEEYQDVPRDRHNRFPYSDSLACRYNFIGLPLVDEYAMLLRKWICEQLRPQREIRPRRSEIIPTHDIDLLYRYHNFRQAFRSIFGRDMLVCRDLSIVRESLGEYREWRKDTRNDPYVKSIGQLVDVARLNGLRACFFFKGLKIGDTDASYDVFDPNVRYCIDHIVECGMTVGLHGSYGSYDDIVQFGRERENLQLVTGRPVTSCRQHYLRFNTVGSLSDSTPHGPGNFAASRPKTCNPSATLRVWQSCGIRDDYTIGYAEQPGFRCGTCHPFPLYDLENDRATDIIEHPLIVMDGSLLDYMKLDIEAGRHVIEQLYARCRAVEGDFIILWHNHICCRQYREYYRKVYLNFLRDRVADQQSVSV